MTADAPWPVGPNGNATRLGDTQAVRDRLSSLDPTDAVPDWAAGLLTAALDEIDLLRNCVAAADEWNAVSQEATLRAAGKRGRYRRARAALNQPDGAEA